MTMCRVVGFWILLCLTAGLAPGQKGGQLQGSVRNEAGEFAAGASVFAFKWTDRPDASFTRDGGQVETGKDGSYSIKGLSAGQYRVCVQMEQMLNGCLWGEGSLVQVSGSGVSIVPTITVAEGATVKVEVEDAGQWLDRVESKSAAPGLLVHAQSPGALEIPATPVLGIPGTKGRVYEVRVPEGKEVSVKVQSPRLRLTDSADRAVPAVLTQMVTARRGAPTVVKVKVTGEKAQ